jgi:hypothetical protein
MMGRQKKDGNHFPTNNKLIQQPEGNEENGYPDSAKQRETIPRNPMKPKEHPQKRNPGSNQ